MNENRDEVTTEGWSYVFPGKSKENQADREPPQTLRAEMFALLGLAGQPVRDPLETLRNSLASWIEQVQAIQTLVQSGQVALGVQEITRILGDHSKHAALRAAAARALAELWKLRKIPLAPFIKALGDSDLDVQVAALQALQAVETYNISDQLLERLLALLKESEQPEHASNEQYKRVQIAIIQCLGVWQRERTFSFLLSALDHRDWEIRDAAVQSIEAIVNNLPPDSGQCIRLQTALKTMIDREEEGIVLQSLILTFEDHTPFRARLMSGSNRVKEKMAHILGDMGAQANPDELEIDIRTLIGVARDSTEDSAVRIAAILRLAQLTRAGKQTHAGVVLSALSRESNGGIQDAANILRDAALLPPTATTNPPPRKGNSQMSMDHNYRLNRNDP